MCQIIQRKPNFEIPFEKFEASIKNNPDGYGISFPDHDGKLITLRSAEKPDAEKQYRLINEELKDKTLLIHHRYTTAGKTVLRNAHPFPILERGTDGIDLRMAHNGTIGKYRRTNSVESDTRIFVKEFVRPLFKRMVKGFDPLELLTDPFIKKLLEDQIPGTSVLCFLDGEGRTLRINPTGNGGKDEGDWWYANTYSFNAAHREASKGSVVPFQGHRMGGNSGRSSTKSGTSGGMARFTEKHNVEFHKLFSMTDDTIDRVVRSPEDAKLLICELLFKLKDQK